MSDRERLPPLRDALVAGRSAVEQVGLAGVPLSLERELRAQFGIELANHSKFATGPVAGHVAGAGANGPVVARRSVVQVGSRDGCRIIRVSNQGAVAMQLGVVVNPLALTVAIACELQNITGATHSIAATTGDTAPGGFPVTFGFYVTIPPATGQDLDWWLPPNRYLVMQADADNAVVNASFEATQAR